MARRKTTTLNLWQHGEDLPLFSGAPQTVHAPAPRPAPIQQPRLIEPTCRACLDTGYIGSKRCWCRKEN